MTDSMMQKMIVFGVGLLFVGLTMSAMSSEPIADTVSVVGGCGHPIYTSDGFGPYYVMDYIPEAPAEGLSAKPTVSRGLPSYFSWKDVSGDDWTTPARNQANCGSCWAFGAMSALEGVINIAWDDPGLDVDLSEQYILSCLPMSGSCNGGESYAALNLILSELANGNYVNGIIPEQCFPYQANSNIPCSEKCDEWESKLIPLVDCGYWRPDFPEDIDAIKAEIMDSGPVVTYFYVTGDFANYFGSHHSPDDYYPYVEHGSANHAVAIVGWKDDPAIGNGGYWIVKNSWGTDWGYDGFFNIEYGSLNIDNVQITWADYAAESHARFSFEPTNPLAADPVQFEDTSSVLGGQVVSWYWDFGDDDTSTLQHPTHAFEENGVYSVSLEIMDDEGAVSTYSENVYVGDQTPPETTLIVDGVKGDSNWYTSRIKINFSSEDDFAGVDAVYYDLDNQGYVKAKGRFSLYHEGAHTLSFYAVDRAGNVEEVQTVSFSIDRTDPLLNLTKPVPGVMYVFNTPVFGGLRESVVIGPIIPIAFASDEVSQLSRVEFYVNHELVGTDEDSPYFFVIAGNHFGYHCILAVSAVDNAGRRTTEKINYMSYSLGLLS